jgi:hypothetical protein
MSTKVFHQESLDAEAASRLAWEATDAARAHQDADDDDLEIAEGSAAAARAKMIKRLETSWQPAQNKELGEQQAGKQAQENLQTKEEDDLAGQAFAARNAAGNAARAASRARGK